MTNRIFYYSLSASVFLHAAVILSLSSSHSIQLGKPLKKIEVTYTKMKSKSSKSASPKEYKIMEDIKPTKKVKIIERDYEKFGTFKKDIRDLTQLKGRYKGMEKRIPKINAVDMKRLIAIPVLKSDKITNPKYLSHKQNMRLKIYQRAFSHADRIGFDEGDVYVSFIVSKEGELKGLRVVPDKTNAPLNLQDISIQSIREAAPFPPFPDELNYKELPFSIVISYMLQEK